MRRRVFTPARVLTLGALAIMVVSVPLSGAAEGRPGPADRLLTHVSQAVAAKYWASHPEAAPERLREGFERIQAVRSLRPSSAAIFPTDPTLLNDDFLGMPQNEESVGVCEENPDNLLGGTNDYRGLLDPEENFTGWHYSTDGGSLARQGGPASVNRRHPVGRRSGRRGIWTAVRLLRGEPELRPGRLVRLAERNRRLQDERGHADERGLQPRLAVRGVGSRLLADAQTRRLHAERRPGPAPLPRQGVAARGPEPRLRASRVGYVFGVPDPRRRRRGLQRLDLRRPLRPEPKLVLEADPDLAAMTRTSSSAT